VHQFLPPKIDGAARHPGNVREQCLPTMTEGLRFRRRPPPAAAFIHQWRQRLRLFSQNRFQATLLHGSTVKRPLNCTSYLWTTPKLVSTKGE